MHAWTEEDVAVVEPPFLHTLNAISNLSKTKDVRIDDVIIRMPTSAYKPDTEENTRYKNLRDHYTFAIESGKVIASLENKNLIKSAAELIQITELGLKKCQDGQGKWAVAQFESIYKSID